MLFYNNHHFYIMIVLNLIIDTNDMIISKHKSLRYEI